MSNHKKVTWLELFYDLIYVVAVSITIHVLGHSHEGHVSWDEIIKYPLIFFPLWWAWTGFTVYVNRYGEDNTHQRLVYIVQMLFVILMSASISTNFNANYLPFLIGYVGIRLTTVYMYGRVWLKRHHSSAISSYLAKGFFIGALISFSSVFFPGDWKFIVLYLGILIDILLPLLGRRILKKHPVQNHHLLERFGLITIILLGECILNIVTTVREVPITTEVVVAGLLGFILAVSIWWHYFESSEETVGENCNGPGHAIIYGHLFVYMSLGILANVIRYGINHELELRQYAEFAMAGVVLYLVATGFIFNVHSKGGLNPKKKWLFFYIASVLIVSSCLLILPNVISVLSGTVVLIVGYTVYSRLRFRKLNNS
ncbi:low temperature requirement protein A [Paenibacillus psychroresistens]|uniref:low temperature requirement protein A n=1 Tax=Paenibacillus psychroresistens TaxID=1778678 RepID=UPI0013909CC6|nr:low temperature requirement protein A [Paenibacillus psychroresistens]